KQHFSDEDLKRLMGEVARILLGTPNRSLSNGREMRYGTRGSMKINLADGVWHDFETDDKGGVLKLIERETGRTGEARFDWLREQGFKPNGDKPSKLGAIVATFDYHAPDGELRFQVVKYDPKNFRQRRPDGKGGWIWDLDGVQKIPYRLPEL